MLPHAVDIAKETISWLINIPSQLFMPSLFQSYPKALFREKCLPDFPSVNEISWQPALSYIPAHIVYIHICFVLARNECVMFLCDMT